MVNPNSQIPGPFHQIRRNNFLQDLSHFTLESRNRNLPPILCKDHIQSAIQLMYHLSLSVDCSADPIIYARQPYNGHWIEIWRLWRPFEYSELIDMFKKPV
ncbi:hypothetical protein XENORESO_006566 [Xenotaenia resolanae]|uniref:Uncharacterized protein n=1 Tax=Xenotaenia resolanae TaxID=208358 RepID=A0ABV0VVM1_9TELE